MAGTKFIEGKFFPIPDEIGGGFTVPDLSDLVPNPIETQKRENLENFGKVIQELASNKSINLPKLVIRLNQ